jgi:hypothetical protein
MPIRSLFCDTYDDKKNRPQSITFERGPTDPITDTSADVEHPTTATGARHQDFWEYGGARVPAASRCEKMGARAADGTLPRPGPG